MGDQECVLCGAFDQECVCGVWCVCRGVRSGCRGVRSVWSVCGCVLQGVCEAGEMCARGVCGVCASGVWGVECGEV